jgi:serine/threonine protein kinase
VLKVIRQELMEDETARKRFLREARAAALLRHPNVAMIYRLGEEEGTCFYVREFVDGETLETKVKRDGPLDALTALEVVLHVAEALVAVKKANLVHRDIKPSSLMMTPEGAVKIIDFGLTKSIPGGDTKGFEVITLSRLRRHSDYASPEQLNEETVDVASDIYSLGVTLWFLLTGRPPFRGPMAQVMAAHLQTPPPFDELAKFPPAVVSLLAHMLEKEPARRPASPTHLVEEIERCIASLKGEAPGIAPTPFPAAPAAIPSAPLPGKMTASREPATERGSGRMRFAEMLIGAIVAVIIYLVLTRPAEPPPTSTPAEQMESAPSAE